MSWKLLEKSRTGPVDYMLSSYSNSLNTSSNATSNALELIGYTQGNITFNASGATTATLLGSIDGTNYFTINTLTISGVGSYKISWKISVVFIKLRTSAATDLSKILTLTES